MLKRQSDLSKIIDQKRRSSKVASIEKKTSDEELKVSDS